MAKKKYDVAVKTGEYTDQQGQKKGRYENIGTVMQGDDGGFFMILKRTFNPAGVANPENRDSIVCSLFEPQQQNQQQPQQQQRQAAPQQKRQAPQQNQNGAPPIDFDENIPF